MKTILVDDEFWSIEQFKIECENVNGINVVGYFDNPLEAFSPSGPAEIFLLPAKISDSI